MILEREQGEREGEREREERNMDVRDKHLWVASYTRPALTWNWTRNLGMCPDQESNPRPFGEQVDAPTTWATWPGQTFKIFVAKDNAMTTNQEIWKLYFKSKQKVQKTFTNWQEKDYLTNRNIGDLWESSFKEPKNMKNH